MQLSEHSVYTDNCYYVSSMVITWWIPSRSICITRAEMTCRWSGFGLPHKKNKSNGSTKKLGTLSVKGLASLMVPSWPNVKHNLQRQRKEKGLEERKERNKKLHCSCTETDAKRRWSGGGKTLTHNESAQGSNFWSWKYRKLLYDIN